MVVARRVEATARAAGVFIALVAALLVLVLAGQVAIAAASLSSTDGYNSDAAPGSTTFSDGSPPVLLASTTGYERVGSLGASARSETSAYGPRFTYTSPAMLVRAVVTATTTERRVVVTGGKFPGLAASRVAAKSATSAYDVAVNGGKHAGFLKNYLGRSTPQIERGIVSIEKQIAEHQAKIRNPAAYIDEWASLDPRQQQALLTSKWPGDIARQQEQLDILRGILGSR